MKLFFQTGMTLLMFSFLMCFSGCQPRDYEKIANEITDVTAKTLLKEKKLYLLGTGGRMMDDIKMMAMSFNYYQEIDLKTARELLLYTVNQYLSNINNNEEVRPYLHEYPFTAKNIEIRIWIYTPDGRKLTPEKIGYIGAVEGILEYDNRSQEKPILEETYEEGMKKLSNQ